MGFLFHQKTNKYMEPIKFMVWHKNTLTADGMPDKERMSPRSWTPQELMEAAIRTEKVLMHDDFIFLRFTGFVDKNKKEIYDGNILLFVAPASKKKGRAKEEKHYYEVFFSDRGQWRARRNGLEHALFPMVDNHEVVGNIYQNADLLK